jgi:predicted exporter
MSDRLTSELRLNPSFGLVANGRPFLDEATIAWALKHRYLLNPPVSSEDFSPKGLKSAFEEVLSTLGTSAALVSEDLVFADPTGRMLRILEYFSQQDAPKSGTGVWMSRDGAFVTLVVRPKADALDLDGQAAVIELLRSAFLRVSSRLKGESGGSTSPQLLISGPGVFALNVREQIIADLSWVGTLTTVCSIIIIIWAFRSFQILTILIVVVGVGVTAGIAAVQLIFGDVHGVTITFGMMLTGIAMDYPIHAIVHARKGEDVSGNLRSIWPTLFLSVATTASAFVPFTASSFPGLAQLGVVSIVGLFATYFVTRYWLPKLLTPRLLERIPTFGGSWSAPTRRTMNAARLSLVAASVCLTAWLVIGGTKVLDDSLVNLSPLPRNQLELDLKLRASIQAVNPRFLMLIADRDREAVIAKSERVSAYLEQMVREKRLIGFDSPSRYLPSLAAQIERKNALPPSDILRPRVEAAIENMSFRTGAFDRFVDDVERARSPDVLLRHDDIRSSVLGLRLGALLFEYDGRWTGVIVFQGDAVPLKEVAEAEVVVNANARFVDLKAEAERMLVQYRTEALLWLGIGAALSFVVLWIGLRSVVRVVRVFLPVAASVALTAIIVMATGISLSLFHLMALSVVAGLAYDFVLFMDNVGRQRVWERATLQALILCALSTVTSYAILSSSRLPILHGIGLTIAIGSIVVFVSAVVFSVGRMRDKRC